jgi:hypothetical protein
MWRVISSTASMIRCLKSAKSPTFLLCINISYSSRTVPRLNPQKCYHVSGWDISWTLGRKRRSYCLAP